MTRGFHRVVNVPKLELRMPADLPVNMRALVLEKYQENLADALNGLKVGELPVPKPKRGQVLVRIRAAPCNPSDLLLLQGKYGTLKKLPTVPGWEGAGEVVASGGGWLANWLNGKRVACGLSGDRNGTWAEYFIAKAAECVRLKRQITYDQAAGLIINPFTAFGLLETARKGGHRAAVHTAGASQLGRMLQTMSAEAGYPLINVVRRKEQIELLRSLGATMLFAVGIGLVLSVPEHHPMLLLREHSGAGALARIAIPALVITIPLVLWLRIQGYEQGYYDLGTGRALGAMALVVGTVAILWIALVALRRHEESLRDVDRRKDEFLATLAHELRNPLAPVMNSLTILDRFPSDENVAADARAIMRRQMKQMVRLIDDLLDVSRISRGTFELRKELVQLQSIVHQAVEAVRAICQAEQQKIKLDFPPESFIDVVRMTIHNPRSGDYVELAGNVEGPWASVSVGDDFAGSPTNQRTPSMQSGRCFRPPDSPVAILWSPFHSRVLRQLIRQNDFHRA